jgi:hypothetical protein
MPPKFLPLALAVATITFGCANDPDAICVAQCNANQKIKCTATDSNYVKEKNRTLAGPDQGVDDCINTCKATRAGIKHCLAEDTAFRRQYIATVRCFPDGKIGSSECAKAAEDLMSCAANQPRQ